MRYAVTLKPRGAIAPDIGLGIALRREEKPKVERELLVEQAAVVAPLSPLPKGVDQWYDTPTMALIPFRQIVGETCPDTPNYIGGESSGRFTLDDDSDYEGDIDGVHVGDRSAWWMLVVPAGVSDVQLILDTWQSVPGPASPSVPADGEPDTVLEVYATDEEPPLDPLPTDATDFGDLIQVAQSDDDPDPAGENVHLSKVTVELEANKVYWIRVTLYSEDAFDVFYDAIYRLRISLSFTQL